jgi:putative DNA methylase
MTWDFGEVNPFSASGGNFDGNVHVVGRVVEASPEPFRAATYQLDATAPSPLRPVLLCTDPPYYDNVPYADLSDFFYIWLRRSIGSIYRELFSTLLTPKKQELVADPHRFDGAAQPPATSSSAACPAFSRVPARLPMLDFQ